MRKAQFLLICCLMLCSSFAIQAQKVKTSKPQKQSNSAAIEREVREFFDSFAEDLRQHRREAIVNRHDPHGYFKMGNGKKTFRSFEETKNHYLNKWKGPKSFELKDISIEVLSPEAVVAVALLEWQRSTGEIMILSFTGLLIKHSGEWRIRVEDESAAPPVKPQTQ